MNVPEYDKFRRIWHYRRLKIKDLRKVVTKIAVADGLCYILEWTNRGADAFISAPIINFDLRKISEIILIGVYKIQKILITHDLSFITLSKDRPIFDYHGSSRPTLILSESVSVSRNQLHTCTCVCYDFFLSLSLLLQLLQHRIVHLSHSSSFLPQTTTPFHSAPPIPIRYPHSFYRPSTFSRFVTLPPWRKDLLLVSSLSPLILPLLPRLPLSSLATSRSEATVEI